MSGYNQITSITKKIVDTFIKLVFIIIYISPLYLLFVIATKSPGDFIKTAYSFPKKIAWENFLIAIEESNYFLLLRNSIIVTGLSVLILVVVSSMAAYPISRYKGKFYSSLNLFFLAGLMIPVQMIILPLYKIVTNLHLMNTYTSLILMNVGSAIPFSVFFMAGFLKTVPNEIDEAAHIDGASKMQTFWLVIFPLIKPAILTLAILHSIFFWNDFLLPLIFLKSNEKMTVMVGIYSFFGERVTDWNYVFALIILSILPILILYFLFQKYIVKGIVAGALKE